MHNGSFARQTSPVPGFTVDWSKQIPQVHRLPKRVMWSIHLMTAVGMAFLNLGSIFAMKTLVRGKFELMQLAIDAGGTGLTGLCWGAPVLIITSSFFALCSLGVIFGIAPEAAGSGAPENKGWLNGVEKMATIFTWKNMLVRATATIFSNASGFPVGREGPTVTMGSNLAYCITELFAYRYVRKKVTMETSVEVSEEIDGAEAEREQVEVSAWIVDQERFAAAKRVACAVGGACGMAMIFDSPIGGIVYMFEEVGAISWPPDTNFSAFGATIICNVITRFFLEQVMGASLKNYVIFQVDEGLSGGSGSWYWGDIPYFVGIAVFLGPFSALHTSLCLRVGSVRQRIMKRIRWPTSAKLFDGLLFAAFCASVATVSALLGGCRAKLSTDREEDTLEFVRFDCHDEGDHNPVASLLVTTSEAAMKLLISRKGDIFILQDLIIAFCAYTSLNILLTGIPVPSGNFTGTMLIGGFLGRAVGVAVNRHLPPGTAFRRGPLAKPGVYAMMGSASMLCGFKQMSMAVVLFIAECGNDWNLIPPLMLCVYVSLMLNRTFLKQGFDEVQMQRKGIPFLEAEPHKSLYGHIAAELCDDVPAGAHLPPMVTLGSIREFLDTHEKMNDIPVVQDDGICMGFTTRLRLECALEALLDETEPSMSRRSIRQITDDSVARVRPRVSSIGIKKKLTDFGKTKSSQDMVFVNSQLVTSLRQSLLDEELLPKTKSTADVTPVPLSKLMDPAPYIVGEKMPAPRVYALFAKVGVNCVCVTSDNGMYKGMISRPNMADMAAFFHHMHDSS